ncbi:MAG: hypothetical protein H0U27_05410 [Nitrosopumilus sp.]|nr:hypothetical protein [Nitrosopumilus sp.]
MIGKQAFRVYNKPEQEEKDSILLILKNMNKNRDYLDTFFNPKRGGVMLNSESPADLSTESPRRNNYETESSTFSISDSDSTACESCRE